MNKSSLKAYAPQARRDFIEMVRGRAALLGLTEQDNQLHIAESVVQGDVAIILGQAYPKVVDAQRQSLIQRIRLHGFDATLEAIAYTWFNRFAALRYMEIHGYLSHGQRVLSSQIVGGLPDILTHALDIAASGDLPKLTTELVGELKLASKDGELYKRLLVAQCNQLADVMPFLFEKIDDETELLLPENLLRTDSVTRKLVESIDETDWQEVEVIGWLYQFYISEKKDQVIGKVVQSEDIPAATQLFTPNWIVKYLVQNSVGRLWLQANPRSTLASKMDYYIQPAEQTPEVQAQLDALIQIRIAEDGTTLNPESITVLDPACGSGHILVEAYDLLKAIYLERGYKQRDIPTLILKNNLFGLDIDDRAAQMAGFALLMKARADSDRLFEKALILNVFAIQESAGVDDVTLCETVLNAAIRLEGGKVFDNHTLFGDAQIETKHSSGLVVNDLRALLQLFEHGKTFGALLTVPQNLTKKLTLIHTLIGQVIAGGDDLAKSYALQLRDAYLNPAILLARTYDAVVANPPYMGGKYQTPIIKRFLKANFEGYEKDLFSAFIIRNLQFAKKHGQLGFMTPFVWMFISSYEQLRSKLINEDIISTLVQLEYSGFEGATVPICTFTLTKGHINNFTGCYIKLSDFKGHENQSSKTLEAIHNRDCGWFFEAKPDDFRKIPASPIAYWASKNTWDTFSLGKEISEISRIREGINTGDNALFLRGWWEVSKEEIGFKHDGKTIFQKKWAPHKKGGSFRRWYGNKEHILNWRSNGLDIHNFHNLPLNYNGAPVRGKVGFFKESLSWSRISSGKFSIRHYDFGFTYDSTAPSIFIESNAEGILGFLNSQVVSHLLAIMSPTLDYRITNLGRLPFLLPEGVVSVVRQLKQIAKEDWDSYERSWDFACPPILTELHKENTLAISYQRSRDNWIKLTNNTQQLEEQNNSIFIDNYALQDELASNVQLKEISLTCNPYYRYGGDLSNEQLEQRLQTDTAAELVSYVIGCMMGRYSLDLDGIVYAHAGNIDFDSSRYSTFPADDDGIVPITDIAWFSDDAANRIKEFLIKVWDQSTLDENLTWLADSLGRKDDESADAAVRRYISTTFYKDHLQTYKKRPIYWLFSSGKEKAFEALVYLHRYNEGTLARMRTEYVVPLSGKIRDRIETLNSDSTKTTSTAQLKRIEKDLAKLTKKLDELKRFDEKLRHYADQRISIDLDDGVKLNYGKFGDLLAEVKAVTGGKADD